MARTLSLKNGGAVTVAAGPMTNDAPPERLVRLETHGADAWSYVLLTHEEAVLLREWIDTWCVIVRR